MKFNYHVSCIYSTAELITPMVDEAKQITFATFARRCNWRPLVEQLGYDASGSLRLSADPYVRFYRSRFDGERCYFLCWSAIEYVFLKGELWA